MADLFLQLLLLMTLCVPHATDAQSADKPSAEITPPRPIFAPHPRYPSEAQREQIEGSVKLSFVVDENGSVQKVSLLQAPLGYGLDEAAMRAVRSWKFEPAMREGKPLKATVQIEIKFQFWDEGGHGFAERVLAGLTVSSASVSSLRTRAESGDVGAQTTLGCMLKLGRGIPADEQEAASWFSKAAESGHGPAQYLLANSYLWGRGVARDMEKAQFWFFIAQRSGVKTLNEDKKRLKKLTREQRAEIRKRADRWLQEHRAKNRAAAR